MILETVVQIFDINLLTLEVNIKLLYVIVNLNMIYSSMQG